MRAKLLLLAAGLLVATGCGGSGPKTYAVTGTVTYEGQPLESGSIAFAPTNPEMPGYQAEITAGKYTIALPAVDMAVKVYANRPSGPYDKVMGGTPTEQYLHTNYNDNTKLKATITAGGTNVHDFKLNKQGT